MYDIENEMVVAIDAYELPETNADNFDADFATAIDQLPAEEKSRQQYETE